MYTCVSIGVVCVCVYATYACFLFLFFKFWDISTPREPVHVLKGYARPVWKALNTVSTDKKRNLLL